MNLLCMEDKVIAHFMPGFNLADNQAKLIGLNHLSKKNLINVDENYIKSTPNQSIQEKFYNDCVSPFAHEIKRATSNNPEEIFFSESNSGCYCFAAGTILYELNGELVSLIAGFGDQIMKTWELINPDPVIIVAAFAGVFADRIVKKTTSIGSQIIEDYNTPWQRPKIITSYGTVEDYNFDATLTNKYKKIKKDNFDIFFFTGWDHKDKLELITKAEPRAVITENCFLHIPKEVGQSWDWKINSKYNYNAYPLWDFSKKGKTLWETSIHIPKKKGYFCLRENDYLVENVIQANKTLVELLPSYIGEPPVYRSQADDAAICYYINIDPKGTIMKNLEMHKRETSRDELIEKIRSNGLIITNKGTSKLRIKYEDNGNVLFILERIMNSCCTMQPYSMLVSKNKKHVTLILNPKEPSKYLYKKEDMKEIVSYIEKKLGWESNDFNMAPQSDACIDIFILTKEKAFEHAEKKLRKCGILSEKNRYVYLAKGKTESDSKLVKMLNSRKGYKRKLYDRLFGGSYFNAYGPPNTEKPLIDAGVKPISAEELRKVGISTDDVPTLHHILEYWQKISKI